MKVVFWRYDPVMALQKGYQIDELLNRHDVIVNGHSGPAIQCDLLFGIIARQFVRGVDDGADEFPIGLDSGHRTSQGDAYRSSLRRFRQLQIGDVMATVAAERQEILLASLGVAIGKPKAAFGLRSRNATRSCKRQEEQRPRLDIHSKLPVVVRLVTNRKAYSQNENKINSGRAGTAG